MTADDSEQEENARKIIDVFRCFEQQVGEALPRSTFEHCWKNGDFE